MSELKIVRGNTFATRTRVRAYRLDGTEIIDFNLAECTDVKVKVRTHYTRELLAHSVLQDNYLRVEFPATVQRLGDYGLEVTGKHRGVDWRFYDRDVLTIVESNAEANIPASSIIDNDYYEVNGAVLVLSDPYDDTEVRAAITALIEALNRLTDRISSLEGGDFH